MLYTLRFFCLQNAVCFIMLTCLVPVLFTFYIQNVLKLKKNNSGAKALIMTLNAKNISNYMAICTMLAKNKNWEVNGYFRLPPPSSWELRSSGLLRGVQWQFLTDVSGQTSWISWPLEMGLMCYPVKSARDYLYTLRNNPEERRSHPRCYGYRA